MTSLRRRKKFSEQKKKHEEEEEGEGEEEIKELKGKHKKKKKVDLAFSLMMKRLRGHVKADASKVPLFLQILAQEAASERELRLAHLLRRY